MIVMYILVSASLCMAGFLYGLKWMGSYPVVVLVGSVLTRATLVLVLSGRRDTK